MNPQLYTWLATINDRTSLGNSISHNRDIVNTHSMQNNIELQKQIRPPTAPQLSVDTVGESASTDNIPQKDDIVNTYLRKTTIKQSL